MGEGLAVEKKEIQNVSRSRGTKTRTNRDTYATTLRYIYDTRMTGVRHSCECLTTFARISLSFIFSQFTRETVAVCSQFILICIANSSHIVGSRKLNCDGSANGSRRVRDTCDDFAIVLRGVLSHKNFGHVQNFRKPFATSSRLLRGYCEPLRAVHDSFETSSRIESQNSREQSHASEIGL